jgi:putative ABC transport system permease protein
MGTLWQDIRYGARTLTRSPGYTLVAVLTLALGIGVNAAIFSAVDAILLRPLPYQHGERIVHLRQPQLAPAQENVQFSVPELLAYRTQSRTMDEVVEYHSMSFNLLGKGDPQRVQTGVVSANFFEVLGVRSLFGRTFRPGEDEAGATPVVVLSYAYWKNRLGGDPNVVGTTVEMTDRVHTIVGVLPPIPQYPDENDVYMPVSSCPFRMSDAWKTNANVRALDVFARLKPGQTLQDAQRDLVAVSRRLHADHADAYPASAGLSVNAAPLKEELTRAARTTLLVLLGTAGLVLLIACANVANLTLVRLVGREREVALRAALGAGRGRILRQLLTESAMLALAGGALGLALAATTVRLLSAFAARFTARAGEISMDGRVLLFTLVVALATGVAFGSFPVLTWGRSLAATLRDRSGASRAGGRRPRVERVLVAAQVALSVVALVAAGAMVRTLMHLQAVDPGFDPERVLTMRFTPSRDSYTTGASIRQLVERVVERVGAQPGVVSVAVAGTFPLNDGQPFALPFQIEGRPSGSEAPPQLEPRGTTPGYFKTVGLPLVRGRLYTAADRDTANGVLLINQTAARRYWGAEDPVGKRVTFDNGTTWLTIVGVVGDVRQWGLDHEPTAEGYAPIAEGAIFGTSLLVRTAADPLRMAGRARDAIHEIDPTIPVDRVRTLAQVRDDSLAAPRLTATLLALFAGLALLIAAAGVGGAVAFSVSRRSHEFGVRMALGARRADVLRTVLRDGMTPVLAGLVLGSAGALALGRVMSGLVVGVTPTDPRTFVAVCAVLAGVSAAACLGPARRATGVDPAVALRSD